MKGHWAKYALTGAFLALLAGCSSKPTDRGQQYIDGKLEQPLGLVNEPNAKGRPVNGRDFGLQVQQIQSASSGLYGRNLGTYSAIQNWLLSGADTRQLRQFGLNAYQMEGTDSYGNVQFTGYYTPGWKRVIPVRANSSIRFIACRRVRADRSCQAALLSIVAHWMSVM